MKFIPLLFNTTMVKSLPLKKQTRRTKGLELINENPNEWVFDGIRENKYCFDAKGMIGEHNDIICPYGKPGDVLWVRETFGYSNDGKLHFRADVCSPKYDKPAAGWKPNIFMPKNICRHFLLIKNIRVERLQSISEIDAILEGINESRPIAFGWMNYINPSVYLDKEKQYDGTPSAVISFFTLWQSINGAKSLDSNPWVWVIEFEQISKPQNFLL